ncbi:Holliday junction resolvase RuvX [Helicobacter apodemus]|uniref:Putative pre-16S rRNA nuclease n=1 Tax=Helicobacter apodemus TaxID=135569 RepID=A0A2U8FDN8_9HELI|nr:Holliday junction resolvase RuvX [Helicobacter apodemus]AWI34361.1 Holliday junction resolvase RuvX [Helicobacter apodemus]
MKNILAIDVGLKRIGLAKYVQNIPLPIAPILRKNRHQAAKALQDFVISNKIDILVVGIPKESNSDMEMRIKHFIGLLNLPQEIEICFIDESFSSVEALEKARESKRFKSKDGKLDSLAALMILERYLIGKE